MKVLLVSIILLTLTTACKTQTKTDVKNVKQDVKTEMKKEVKEEKKELKDELQMDATKTALLSNCKISIEKTFFWMNKMPMVGPKPDFTPLRLAAILKLDNSKGEDMSLNVKSFIHSKDSKIATDLIAIKDQKEWDGIVKAGEVLEIEFKGNNIDSRKVKGNPSVIFKFTNQKDYSVTLESDTTRVNIAY